MQKNESRHLTTRNFLASTLGDPATWVQVLPNHLWPLPYGWKSLPEHGWFVYLRSRYVTQKLVDEYMVTYQQSLSAILRDYFQPIQDELARGVLSHKRSEADDWGIQN